MRRRIAAFVREPLVHFFLLGAAIFLAFELSGGSGERATEEIVVSRGEIARLVAGFEKTWMRPPTPAEIDGLIEDFVREEIYYRQAIALGLDRDNPIIRRVLRQKMEFLAEDVVHRTEPDDATLQAYLDANASVFQVEPRIGFRHVYVDAERRADARGEAARLLAALREERAPGDAASLGDPSPLPSPPEPLSPRELDGRFGRGFAEALMALPEGRWEGPVASSYGLHLVFVSERTEARAPALAEVREKVLREWEAARRAEVQEALYRRLREQYTVAIERPEGAS